MHLSKQRIKDLAKLSIKKYRKRCKQVLVEGVNTIEQLVSNGFMPLELYYSRLSEIVERCKPIPSFEVSEAELNRICMTESPQTLVALYAIPELQSDEFSRAFYLDGVSDPGNVGTIYRIASAFGFDAVILSSGCCDPFSPKVIRSSLGSVFWIPTFNKDAKWLSQRNEQLLVLTVGADRSLNDMELRDGEKLIVVLGSEAHGVSDEVLCLPAQHLRINMQSRMESLNAAVVAGIVAHRIYTLLS